MIDGQFGGFSAAVLAGVVVTAEDFRLGQLDGGARPFDHMLESDNRRGGIKLGNCFDIAAAVSNQTGFL